MSPKYQNITLSRNSGELCGSPGGVRVGAAGRHDGAEEPPQAALGDHPQVGGLRRLPASAGDSSPAAHLLLG